MIDFKVLHASNAFRTPMSVKVTYTNHKTYGKADKSIVRIFTDFPANSFELPTHLGYRYVLPL